MASFIDALYHLIQQSKVMDQLYIYTGPETTAVSFHHRPVRKLIVWILSHRTQNISHSSQLPMYMVNKLCSY